MIMRQLVEIADEMWIAHNLIKNSNNGGNVSKDEFLECVCRMGNIRCPGESLGNMIEALGSAYKSRYNGVFTDDVETYGSSRRV